MSGINKICSNLTLTHNVIEVSRKVYCFSVSINISKNLAVLLKDIEIKILGDLRISHLIGADRLRWRFWRAAR